MFDIKSSRNFLLKENVEELDEMAKITGGLKATIEAIMEENPELDGLALKKVIRADEDVIDLLAGDDLYDNQLNKFIALYKGQRELQPRGRKARPKEGDAPINEMAKIAGELKSAIEKVISDNPQVSGLALKKLIKSNPEVITALGNEKLHDNQLNGFISNTKGSSTESPKSLTQTPGQPFAEVPTTDNELEDTWNTPSEDDDEEIEPGKNDIDNSIKVDTPTDASGVGAANNYKNIIVTKVNKIEALPGQERAKSIDMQALKKFIQKPEVIKALTMPTIRDLVSSIIG